jgi:hypothetical protein
VGEGEELDAGAGGGGGFDVPEPTGGPSEPPPLSLLLFFFFFPSDPTSLPLESDPDSDAAAVDGPCACGGASADPTVAGVTGGRPCGLCFGFECPGFLPREPPFKLGTGGRAGGSP